MCLYVEMVFSVFHHLKLSFVYLPIVCKKKMDFPCYCKLIEASCVFAQRQKKIHPCSQFGMLCGTGSKYSLCSSVMDMLTQKLQY